MAHGLLAAAPVLAQALYGTQDLSKLTQEQKDTLTTIANLAGTAIGATTVQGANVVASSQAAQNAVKNNYLDHDEMVSTRDKLVACADSECRKKVYQNSKALSQKNRDDFIKTCAKNGTSSACLAKKQAITRAIVEDRQGEFDSDGSVPEIDDMMRNLDEINLNDNTVGPALVAEQNAREAAIGYGATEKQAKEVATIAAAAISIIQNKKGKGRGKPLDGSTSTVVRSGDKAAGVNTATTQVKNVVPKSVKVSKSKHPETAQHIQDAQAAGHPKTLTINRAGTAQNRKDSLRGVKTQAGKDRDEYPPAMFQEGGSGASVRHITPGDNRGAGSSIGAQCRGLACGTQVTIDVVD